MSFNKLVLGVLALAAASCSDNSSRPASDQVRNTPRPSGASEPEQVAGVAAALDLLNSEYIECNDVYTTRQGTKGYSGEYLWMQLAGLDLQLLEEELSNADRLNGLTFKGSVKFGNDFVRRRYMGKWLDWKPDSGMNAQLTQKNGTWELIGDGGVLGFDLVRDDFVRPNSCEEIPKD